MLKINREFITKLQQCPDDHDEIYILIEDHILNDYTRGYIMCKFENDWSESLELKSEVNDFCRRFII